MSLVLTFVLALAAAVVNVAAGWWLGRRAKALGVPFVRLQCAGFAFRFAVLFGAAGWLWTVRHDVLAVAVFIIVGAVAQMVGQIVLFMKRPYA